jgi:DNA-binding CsgD family transcriptional regulator/tetratricopeptide (TPR) repeat protein
MAELDLLFRRSSRGEFRCVVLHGDPGVGKSRLAAELLARYQSRAAILRARGHMLGAAASFGLWAELFDGYLRGRASDEVTRLCGGFVDDLAGLLRTAATVRGSWRGDVPLMQIREALAVLLGNLSRTRPAVLLLDDMHLADASSWEALGYLARNLADARVLVLVCARLDELVERSVGRHVLFGLEQDDVLSRIELRPLEAADIRELAERVLGRPSVPPTLVEWLFDESQGNPLFAVNLLDALLEEGADLGAPSLTRVPQALSARVAARGEALDGPSREILELLAVVGRRIEMADLQRLSARSQADLARAVSALVEARLALRRAEDADLVCEISHPLIQEAIYERLEAPRRRALHQRIARVLAESDRLGEAASHYGRCAQPGDSEAISVLLRALRETWARQTLAEAFVILGSLVDLLPLGDVRWIQVLDALPPNAEWAAAESQMNFDIGPGVLAFQEIERVLQQRHAESVDPRRLALVNAYLAGLLGWCLGELDEAAVRAAAAVDLFRGAGDEDRSLAAGCKLAWIEGLARRYGAQERAIRSVLAAAEAAASHKVILTALVALAATARVRGNFDVAEASLERSIALSRAEQNPARLRVSLAVLGETLALRGDLHRAREVLEEADAVRWAAGGVVAVAEESPTVIEVSLRLRSAAGDFVAVAEEAPRVAALLPPQRQAWLLACAAAAAAEVGDLATAYHHLEAGEPVLGRRRIWIMSDQYDWAAGRVALAAGAFDVATMRLEVAATALLDTGALPYAVHVLADLAEASAMAGQPIAAQRAAVAAEQAAGQLQRPHFHALAALAASAAALALRRVDAAAQSARQAVTLLSGSGYIELEARSLALLGRSLATRDRHEAVERLSNAADLFAKCGSQWRRDYVLADLKDLGKPGQRAVAASLGPESLTDREREIAALAGQGLSARAIGQRLHIGERTVESHLARVYGKFGVHSRQELLHTLAGQKYRSSEPTTRIHS